jgi:predicted outer membrane repeat protein
MRINHIAICLIGILLALNAHAANLIVTNSNNTGPGSLRQAIQNNNSSGGNTIIFSNNVTGTITLTTGELLISKDVTILGPGASVLAIDGDAASRVFHITNCTAYISGLTITNGRATGNVSPADSGGGIYSVDSTNTLSACILTGNVAIYGGAIYNEDDAARFTFMTVSNCTLSGNSATNDGGAIYNDGNDFAEVDLTSSTLSSNSAALDGGGIFSLAHRSAATLLKFSACTLSGNSATLGGGIYNGQSMMGGNAEVDIGNTILNAGSMGSNIVYDALSTVVSLGYNLSSDSGSGVLTNATDQINTDPMLGPLGYYGGQTTTMALLAGSPAIDEGNSFGLTTDQRGLPRPAQTTVHAAGGDGSSIGAYEPQALQITEVAQVSTNLQLSFMSLLGTNYVVQSRADMVLGNWASLPGSTAGNGWIAQINVTNAFTQPQQFYRIGLQP